MTRDDVFLVLFAVVFFADLFAGPVLAGAFVPVFFAVDFRAEDFLAGAFFSALLSPDASFEVAELDAAFFADFFVVPAFLAAGR
ncbi:hypothetical protein ACWC2K_35235 [Streptomyces chattanoogensis]